MHKKNHGAPLRVTSWPGYNSSIDNQFIKNFLDGLQEAGASIQSLEDFSEVKNLQTDVLVVHWLDSMFWGTGSRKIVARRLVNFFSTLFVLKTRGVKVVWIVHNLKPHSLRAELNLLWGFATSILSRMVDGALTLSPSTVSSVKSRFPGLRKKPVSYFWHPAYEVAAVSETQRSELRTRAGLSPGCFVLGYCGIMRRSKGIIALIEAFRAIPNSENRLLLSGVVHHDISSEIEGALGADSRIRCDLRNLSYEEFNVAVATCDIFVAPFQSYLHSGSIIHALCAHRPVLTPKTAFSEDLLNELGPEWIRLYNGNLTSEILEHQITYPVPEAPLDLGIFEKKRTGHRVAQFIRELQ